jgi:hypothetical protein
MISIDAIHAKLEKKGEFNSVGNIITLISDDCL